MLAWMVERRLRCPTCGTAEEERDGLVAEAYRCMACERLEAERDLWRGSPTAARGVSIRLYRRGKQAPRPPDTASFGGMR